MIFWEKLKIQDGQGTIELSKSGSALALPNTIFTGTVTFNDSIILPAGSNFQEAVTLPAESGIENVLTSTQLTIDQATINEATINNALTATAINVSGTSSLNTVNVTDTLNVTGSVNMTGSVALPANTSIGGAVVRPGPRQKNLLYIDGHFGNSQDWVSVRNLSINGIYVFIQLYRDAAFTTPYLKDGRPVIGYTSQKLVSGAEARILEFYDDAGDPFATINGYVRIKYSTSEMVSDSSHGFDINDSIRANDLTGSADKYTTYGNPTQPADWLRSVLYKDNNESWYLYSIPSATNKNVVWQNMITSMRTSNYTYYNYNGTWYSIDYVSEPMAGGIIGFIKNRPA